MCTFAGLQFENGINGTFAVRALQVSFTLMSSSFPAKSKSLRSIQWGAARVSCQTVDVKGTEELGVVHRKHLHQLDDLPSARASHVSLLLSTSSTSFKLNFLGLFLNSSLSGLFTLVFSIYTSSTLFLSRSDLRTSWRTARRRYSVFSTPQALYSPSHRKCKRELALWIIGSDTWTNAALDYASCLAVLSTKGWPIYTPSSPGWIPASFACQEKKFLPTCTRLEYQFGVLFPSLSYFLISSDVRRPPQKGSGFHQRSSGRYSRQRNRTATFSIGAGWASKKVFPFVSAFKFFLHGICTAFYSTTGCNVLTTHIDLFYFSSLLFPPLVLVCPCSIFRRAIWSILSIPTCGAWKRIHGWNIWISTHWKVSLLKRYFPDLGNVMYLHP